MAPESQPTVSASVHARLRREILRGELELGAVLPPEPELAQQLGADQGAVREAIDRLERAGLVANVQAGARVQDWRRSGDMDLLFDLATNRRDPNSMCSRTC